MTSARAVELYYAPFDVEIDDNPYSVWKRMREEAHHMTQKRPKRPRT
jgi:hypothetical protein